MYHAFLLVNEKFNCLDLRDEDKLYYFMQGLRADIQAEVLKKEPTTYTEAVHPSEKRRCLTYCTGC